MPSAIASAFAELLRADPGALVACTPAGPRTRRDLDRSARLIEARLAEAQLVEAVGTGRRIGLCLRDGFQLLAAFLAVARRDQVAVLLDAADPRAPRLDLASRLGMCAVVVDVPEVAVRMCGPTQTEAPPQDEATWRAIKLTSGSTGEPNAIAVGDRELLADADALERTMGIGAGDRVLAAVPMSFSYGVGNLLIPALARGRELVLPGETPLALLRAMRMEEPTVLPAVPALLRALLQGSFEMPTSMRLVISAGAVLPPEVATAFRKRFALSVHTFYGSTESGGVTYDRTGMAAERGTVGTPVDGVEVDVGDDGRVRIASAAVGQAVALAAGRPVAANPSCGRFLAPDLGEWRDGELRLCGRAGTVFDVGGHKVDPREIEAMVRDLPQVHDVAVLPWRDDHGRAVCAAVVAGQGLSEELVRRHCARLLPAAKVPRRLLVVAELPRTSRGKLSRERVEQLLVDAGSSGAVRASSDRGSLQ